MRCDVIASGILEAIKEISGTMPPIIVRLSGTYAQEGLKKLAEAKDVAINVAGDMESAARMAVRLAHGSTEAESCAVRL